MYGAETADQVDDDISEYGWRTVSMGLHRKGTEVPIVKALPKELCEAKWKALGEPNQCGTVVCTGCYNEAVAGHTAEQATKDMLQLIEDIRNLGT